MSVMGRVLKWSFKIRYLLTRNTGYSSASLHSSFRERSRVGTYCCWVNNIQ